MLAMIAADRAFARIMGKTAPLRAFIERPDGVGAQRAEAHRRYVENRSGVRLGAICPADEYAEARRVGDGPGPRRVGDEFIAVAIHIHQRSEWSVADLILGTRIDERALAARKGRLFLVALDKILPDRRTNAFEEPPQPSHKRIISPDRMFGLSEIHYTRQRQSA